MIVIRPSPTADTRTCDWSKVTKEQLLASSVQHIEDIRAGLEFFRQKLIEQGLLHDHDKISDIDGFHADFRTGFKQQGWWDNHRKVNRHHLTAEDGIPADVNLIDVLDFIVDCVMAGMARSGSVYPLSLPPELLERAFQNTVALLKENVTVATPDQPTSASVCPFQGPGKSVYTPTLCPVCNNDFRKCAEIRDADQPNAARKTVWKPYDVFGVTGRLVYEDTGEDVPDQPGEAAK